MKSDECGIFQELDGNRILVKSILLELDNHRILMKSIFQELDDHRIHLRLFKDSYQDSVGDPQLPSQSAPTIPILITWVGLKPWKEYVPKYGVQKTVSGLFCCYSEREEAAWPGRKKYGPDPEKR